MSFSKGFGKGKDGKDGKGGFGPRRDVAEYLDYCEGRVDPADQGQLPKRLLPLSRNLATKLRYKDGQLRRHGIEIDREGWVELTEVLQLPDFEGFDVRDVREVVNESYSRDQKRFEIRERGPYVADLPGRHVRTIASDGRLQIRAAHKRPAAHQRRFAERGQNRPRRAPSPPGPPDVTPQWEDALNMKRNKMRVPGGAKPTEHFDIGEDPSDEDVDLPLNFSNKHVEWGRFEFQPGVFGWWCRRADGTEDGFVELTPDPWDLIYPDESAEDSENSFLDTFEDEGCVRHLLYPVLGAKDEQRPCWINKETEEYFCISEEMAETVLLSLAELEGEKLHQDDVLCADVEEEMLSDNVSNLQATWERFEMEGGRFGWRCTRPDGAEECFSEEAPDHWDLLTLAELEGIGSRPCWINKETGEYFFVSGDGVG